MESAMAVGDEAGYDNILKNIAGAKDPVLQLNSPRLGSAAGYFASAGNTDSRAFALRDFGEREMEAGMEMGGGHGHMGAMGGFDHELSFEPDGLLDGLHNLPFTPSYDLDTFSATFEDPFSYQSDTFPSLMASNTAPTTHTHPHPTSSALNDVVSTDTVEENLDNKLLSFGATMPKATVFDDRGQTWPSMSAELYGMFFVAEDVFGDTASPAAGRPMELTCYRRNLFQISGSITLSRGIKGLLTEHGQQVPLYDLSVTLSAVEGIEGKATEIISVPWKTAGTGGAVVEDKSGGAPPKWPLDLSQNPEVDPTAVTIPIAWKRLQFKHATANNGRRKGLQQHYTIQINLVGTLPTGESVQLCEVRSGPIIVRGRSPRNFDSRKDVSLAERKVEPKQRTQSDTSRDTATKVDPGVGNGNLKFYSSTAVQQPLDLPDWNSQISAPLSSPSIANPPDHHRAKKPALLSHGSSSSISGRPPVPRTKWKSEVTPTKAHATAPIDLSLVDEDHGRSFSIGPHSGVRRLSFEEASSPQIDRSGENVGKKAAIGSPTENADTLYEYFPLSLDDWMPPVDAIYRPHVVHHTIVPPDLKAEHMKSKTKRYFSADD